MNNLKRNICFALVFILCMIALTPALAQTNGTEPENPSDTSQKNEPTDKRINQLKEIAMYYYWHDGDIKKAEEEVFQGITLKGKYDVVENTFLQATLIDPHSLDLKFSLASTQIIQGKIPEALKTYKQILNLDPSNFEGHLLYGVYSKVNGDERAYKNSLTKLKSIDSKRAGEYDRKIKETEKLLNERLNTVPPANVPAKDHAIVILGYALAENGEMQPVLIERLKVGLAVAKKYPNSKIIVTGGVPKQGITEADAMSKWLMENGIAKERMIMEKLSTDTVENGLFSTAILEKERIKDVTLVTSASHMRRALAVFREASGFYDKMTGKKSKRNFTNVVYLDYPTLEEAHRVTRDELLGIYRDLIRTSGIWQYPGLQR